MSQAQFAVEKKFSILKDGVFIVLTEEEMKDVLLQPDVLRLINEMQLILENASSQVIEKTIGFGTFGQLEADFAEAHVTFPEGFVEIKRIESDPKAAHKAMFVYAQNPISREYGFRIVSDKGRVSQFNKVGSIHDSQSVIGSFLRSIPKHGKPMIKQDFLKLGLQVVTEGRRLKALIDIAELEGYLEKRTLQDRKGRTGYLVTAKLLELGGAKLA